MLTTNTDRRRGGGWILPVLIITGGAALGAWFASVRNRSTEPALVIAPEDLDFGEAWVQDGFEWTVPVSNVGDRDIDVLRVAGSCDCSRITPGHFVLAPGETKKLLVALRLLPKRPGQVDAEAWDFSVDLRFETRTAPPGTLSWTLHGRVRNSLSIAPHVVETQLITGEPDQTVTAVVSSRNRLSALTATCDPALARVSVDLDQNGSEYVISVTPNMPPEPGPFQFNVNLHPIAGDGTALPAVPLPVRGTLVEDVAALPPVLLVDAAQTNPRPAEKELVLTSHSGKGFRVVGIEQDDDGLNVRAASGKADNTDSAQAFLVSRAGVPETSDCEVRFEVLREGETIPRTVPVVIHYTCPSASAQPRPTASTTPGDTK